MTTAHVLRDEAEDRLLVGQMAEALELATRALALIPMRDREGDVTAAALASVCVQALSHLGRSQEASMTLEETFGATSRVPLGPRLVCVDALLASGALEAAERWLVPLLHPSLSSPLPDEQRTALAETYVGRILLPLRRFDEAKAWVDRCGTISDDVREAVRKAVETDHDHDHDHDHDTNDKTVVDHPRTLWVTSLLQTRRDAIEWGVVGVAVLVAVGVVASARGRRGLSRIVAGVAALGSEIASLGFSLRD